MSVKLSLLKVPENAPELFRAHITRGIYACKYERLPASSPQWIESCAVAALLWRKAEQDMPCASEVPGDEQYVAVVRKQEALVQAELWQRAAFEGVEP